MLNYFLCIFLFSQFFLIQCVPQKKSYKNKSTDIYKFSNSTKTIDEISISDPLTYTNNPEIVDSMISNILDFKLGDSIKLDSPKRFLQISILFTLVQNSNYHTISKKDVYDDEKVSAYMSEKRIAFYKKLGISEDEYINYGIQHSELIQEYLATNTDMSYIYDIIQTQVTD